MDKDGLSRNTDEVSNNNQDKAPIDSSASLNDSNNESNLSTNTNDSSIKDSPNVDNQAYESVSSKRLKNSQSHDPDQPHKHHTKHGFKKFSKNLSSYIKQHRIATTFIFLALTIIIIIDVWYFIFKPQSNVINSKNSQVVTEYKEKLPELKKAIEKNPKDATARRNYAVALYVISDLEAAKTQYEEATKLDSKDATTFNNLGNTYRDLKNYDKAVESYNKAIELNPKYTNAYVNLANVQLYSQKKTDNAIATYKKALKAMPNDNQIELLLGIAYETAGKTTEAKQTFQNILSRSPDDKAAKSNLDRLNKK